MLALVPMGKTPKPYRRRNFFIKKGLQSRFIIGFSLAVLAGFSINLIVAYYLIDREMADALYKIHIKFSTTSQIVGPILWKLSAVTIPLIIVISAVAGYLLTRLVEFPLRTFMGAVEKTASGDFSHRLSGDSHTDIPEYFNNMNSNLEVHFRKMRTASRRLDAEAGRMDEVLSSSGGSKTELARCIWKMKEATDDLAAEMKLFKL